MSIKKIVNKVRQIVGLDADGNEVLDTTPVEIPLGFNRPPSIQETIARYMNSAALLAERQGMESFEEAEDFDVGDDYDPSSPYELDFDHISGREMYKGEKQFLDEKRKEFDSYVKQKRKELKKKPDPAPQPEPEKK